MRAGVWIIFLIGLLAGNFINILVIAFWKNWPDGYMVVNTSDINKDVFRLEMRTPFGEIPKKKHLYILVKNESKNMEKSDPSMEEKL